ncbi:MAG: hypothetical protein EOO50_03720 [Flavobacterium sp.]|uniref:hypothetical protein n=1 Tax=Flavobacterium sp. TaxID=239 RepID=UPI00120D04C1|nr:hypothetical protein [Flavobacterium sp.]RZJ67943.1 MAG: hypothetical protein EOO50_03720 [Flavobacterium sp.]
MMKKGLWFALLVCSNMFAQQYLVKKGGTKIDMHSFHVNESKKRVEYKANSQNSAILFNDVDSLVVDKKVLKRFDIGKKQRLLYVIASSKGKTLATSNKMVSRYVGGFESVVKQYEIVLIENGKATETLKFTARESDAEDRAKVFKIASTHFMDCNSFMERLALLGDQEDKSNLILLNYLDNPERLYCKK